MLTPWLGKVLVFARVLFKLLAVFFGIIEIILSDVAGACIPPEFVVAAPAAKAAEAVHAPRHAISASVLKT